MPEILKVLTWLASSRKSLAMPKSEILGFSFSSRSTLLALMSLWMIFTGDSSWR